MTINDDGMVKGRNKTVDVVTYKKCNWNQLRNVFFLASKYFHFPINSFKKP